MLKHHVEPWIIFMAMSVLAHAAVLVSWGGRIGVADASLEEVTVSQVLNIELVKQAPLKNKQLEVPPEPEPMPVAEDKIIEEVKSLEKALEQAVEEPQETVEQQVAQVMEPQVQGEQLQHDHQLQLKQKEQYIQTLMKHIDAHKFYPAAARRRGIEGEVQVSFCLTADKTPEKIEANGTISVLERAAIRAVQDASPFPEPPADTFFNSPIVISMVYALE